jgi:competence protein ComEC
MRGRPAAVFGVAVLLAYANLVAAGPSVWRATLMAVTYLAARAIDHRTAPWQASAVAAAVMLLWRPLDVRDAGFLLTFGATVESVGVSGSTLSPDVVPRYLRSLASDPALKGGQIDEFVIEKSKTRLQFRAGRHGLVAPPKADVSQTDEEKI